MAQLPLIAGIVSAGGSIVSGVAAVTQGRAQAQAFEQYGSYNARVAELEASLEEDRVRRDNARRLGALRAAIAGRGVQLEGSPLEVLSDQVAEAEEQALLVRYGGQLQKQKTLYESRADAAFAGSQGLAIGFGEFGKAGGSLLGGIADYIEPRPRRY